MIKLKIWFEDEHYLVIEKPSGYFVHPSKLDKNAPDCQTILANERGERYQPVHRLDRGTSGINVFAKSKEATEKLSQLFREHNIRKEYHALVRGWILDAGEIQSALTSEERGIQEAATLYRPLEWFECPWGSSQFPTSRYSWVRLQPLTGRKHQLRKHLSHLRHPILGDSTHGDSKQNRIFFTEMEGLAEIERLAENPPGEEIKKQPQKPRMLLFASKLSFLHPYSGKLITLHSNPSASVLETLQAFHKPIL